MLIEDGFVTYLFDIIEGLSDDVNDPYHYPVIRVLVCIFFDSKAPVERLPNLAYP